MKLKRVELGDNFTWEGQQTSVNATSDGRVIYFTTTKQVTCSNCGHVHLEPVHHAEVEASPNFQNGARPIQTVKYVKEELKTPPPAFYDLEKNFGNGC